MSIYRTGHIKLQSKQKNLRMPLLLPIICIFIITIIFANRTEKYYIEYSQAKVTKNITSIINKIAKNHVSIENKYFQYEYNNAGKIISINIDSAKANKLIAKMVEEGEKELENIENGNTLKIKNVKKFNDRKQIIIFVPISAALKNNLFYNIGPRIPVRIELLGYDDGTIETEARDYGINNTLIEVYAIIRIKEKIILPTRSKIIEVKTKTLLASKLAQGDVPNFYTNNYNSST